MIIEDTFNVESAAEIPTVIPIDDNVEICCVVVPNENWDVVFSVDDWVVVVPVGIKIHNLKFKNSESYNESLLKAYPEPHVIHFVESQDTQELQFWIEQGVTGSTVSDICFSPAEESPVTCELTQKVYVAWVVKHGVVKLRSPFDESRVTHNGGELPEQLARVYMIYNFKYIRH